MEEIRDTKVEPQISADNSTTQSSPSQGHGQVPYVIYPYADFTELDNDDDDSNLRETFSNLFRKVWKQKIWLFTLVALFTALGVVIAINTPKMYTSNAVLAPEIQGNKTGGTMSRAVSALGLGSAGNQGVDAIYPDIYPEVLASRDFLESLLEVKVSLKNNTKERSYATHVKEDLKPSMMAYFTMWIASLLPSDKDTAEVKIVKDDPNARFKMSKEKDNLCKMLAASVSCSVDKKTSIVSLSFVDQDPLVAAIMLDTIQNRIQSYITEYRTKKARVDFAHYTALLKEAEDVYEKTKAEYVRYCEANIEVQQAGFIVQRAALENRMSRDYALTNTYRQQVQGAEAKIQEVKPAFTVIESPKMANKPSGSSRKTIVLGFMFLGFAVDVLRVLIFKRDKKEETAKAKSEKAK